MSATKSNSTPDTLAGLDSQLRCFSVARDDRGVVSVSLDVPDRSMNVVDERVLDELTWIVNSLQTDSTAKVVVFRSGKASGFLAGADVHEIAALHDEELIAQTLQRGQDLFDRIEQIPAVTVAAIDGPCMGGGLEWALACDLRVVSDSPTTRLGLPEIRLGLMPAWGGTQRLPQTVGLATALPLILKGKTIDAAQAIKIGLANRLISGAQFSSKLASVVSDILDGKLPQRQRHRSWTTRIAERLAVGRRMILQQARHEIHKQDPEQHYPAPLLVVDAIERGLTDYVDGFVAEREHFSTLLKSSAARRLMGLFFQRERAKNLKTWAPLAASDTSESTAVPAADLPAIHNIVVVGGGVMGAEIAQFAAAKGFHVTVKEIDTNAADAARRRMDELIQKWAKHYHADDLMLANIRKLLHVSCDNTGLADADLLIEAVVEHEIVKREVFRDAERWVRDDTLLVSNTSSLQVQRLAEVTSRPQRVAGLHFFNPVSRMELVEVVQTHDTDEAALQRLLRFTRALGKTPVVTADSPGFIVNRVLFPYLGEAVQMTIEGFDAEFIDTPMRSFGMPMGPLELLDHVGIDVAAHVASSLSGVLPDCQAVAERLQEMCEAGELGKKSGQGFYLYQDGKKNRPVITGQSECFADKEVFCDDGLTPTQRRVLYPMINEAMRCLDEKIVRESWMVDLAVVLGTGFAPFRGGPLQWLEDTGADVVRQNMEILAEQFGSHFEPAPGLLAAAQWKEPLMRLHPSTGLLSSSSPPRSE